MLLPEVDTGVPRFRRWLYPLTVAGHELESVDGVDTGKYPWKFS